METELRRCSQYHFCVWTWYIRVAVLIVKIYYGDVLMISKWVIRENDKCSLEESISRLPYALLPIMHPAAMKMQQHV